MRIDNSLILLVQTYDDDDDDDDLAAIATWIYDWQTIVHFKNAWKSFRKHLLGPSQIEMGICF